MISRSTVSNAATDREIYMALMRSNRKHSYDGTGVEYRSIFVKVISVTNIQTAEAPEQASVFRSKMSVCLNKKKLDIFNNYVEDVPFMLKHHT